LVCFARTIIFLAAVSLATSSLWAVFGHTLTPSPGEKENAVMAHESMMRRLSNVFA